jgi:2-phospho-L-lactate guanylyltransferase
VAWALEHGARRVLLVPGDCPALAPKELDELLGPRPAPGPEVVVVPDRHGTGTNGLVLTPPEVIAPSFGPGSRARHEAAAEAAGARSRIAEPPSLVLDVDTAEDFDLLRAMLDERVGGAAHTRGLLARLDRR